MIGKQKNQQEILEKLGIKALNPMQLEAQHAITAHNEVILLSPTGTGKTVAFLLPVIAQLNPDLNGIQALIIVPSRELAIQIEQVAREMGSGYKINAVYGGRSGTKDKIEFKHPPAILIGTPGRVADHLRRENFEIEDLTTLVLDEFDKSLEIGFEEEMHEILDLLPYLKKKILTSATQKIKIPDFMEMKTPTTVNFIAEKTSQLQLKLVEATHDKLPSLIELLGHIGDGNGIIFCNLKDTINSVSDHLNHHGISYTCFYGGMEQLDRERALIKFRNGTSRILLATDLAARGIDIPEMDFIIHFEIPFKQEEFIHRNGRTARMQQEGTAYILKGPKDYLPDFARIAEKEEISFGQIFSDSQWETLFISGGRKDKISKGDIAGLFFKQGGLDRHELGTIELKQDCAFVAVPKSKAKDLINRLNNSRLKTKKVRISLL